MLGHGILTGKYKPGMRLNESQIARELNISRIPVREALSQLQEQGLVQNRERRGMFVTHIGPQEVEHIFALRLLLEGEALRLARIHMTAPDPPGTGRHHRQDGSVGRQPAGIRRLGLWNSTALCGRPAPIPIWSGR